MRVVARAEETVEIVNARGLHARAAARFAKIAAQFDADIRVSNVVATVGGSSIMGLLMLGAARGEHIRIEAKGRDAETAVKALVSLVASGFEEGGEPGRL